MSKRKKAVPRPLRTFRENTARVLGASLALALLIFSPMDFAWSLLWGAIAYAGARIGLGELLRRI